MTQVYEFPEGWGEDKLSNFQHLAFANELWSYAQDTAFNKLLADCDTFIFQSFLKAAPKHKGNADTGALLFINAHNHFRAAARLCLSSQLLPVFPTARASLESAVYGWYLKSDPKLATTWHSKPEPNDWKALKKWNDTFRFSSITKLIGSLEPNLVPILKQTHQTAIDFGAHPNKEALYSNLIPYPDESLELYSIGYIHKDGQLIPYTCSFMLDIALSILVLIRLAYPVVADDGVFYSEYNSIVKRVNAFQRKAHAEVEALKQAGAK